MHNGTDSLLAVDLGLKTGLALYRQDGRLSWYRSKNYGSIGRLKRDVHNILGSISSLRYIILEGDKSLSAVWEQEAARRNMYTRNITAEQWRRRLLYEREQKSGPDAKINADHLARKVIKWSNLSGSTSLRHDAAEAIMIGLWAVIERGWLQEVPPEIRR
ncbi:MAG: hypothetical protein JSW20_04075 [Nitrospiraceae bacterium]|nr:MAG: hypothetical protein JSW20_04075 [Nitrospiraceae bacterium]